MGKTAIVPFQVVEHDCRIQAGVALFSGWKSAEKATPQVSSSGSEFPRCVFEKSEKDYSGDHKNTREVTKFPSELLLTKLQSGQLSREIPVSTSRNALHVIRALAVFRFWNAAESSVSLAADEDCYPFPAGNILFFSAFSRWPLVGSGSH